MLQGTPEQQRLSLDGRVVEASKWAMSGISVNMHA